MKKISTLAVILFATINLATANTPAYTNFKSDLANFTNTYLKLKDSFVKSDVAKIDAITAGMVEYVQDINMDGLKSSDMEEWHNDIFEIKSNLGEILSAKDLNTKRIAFAKLSETLANTLKTFNTGQELYVIKCPMFEGGSYWLSNSKTIENPFYGDDMLTCGSVVDTL